MQLPHQLSARVMLRLCSQCTARAPAPGLTAGCVAACCAGEGPRNKGLAPKGQLNVLYGAAHDQGQREYQQVFLCCCFSFPTCMGYPCLAFCRFIEHPSNQP